jgi:hypothetical protein
LNAPTARYLRIAIGGISMKLCLSLARRHRNKHVECNRQLLNGTYQPVKREAYFSNVLVIFSRHTARFLMLKVKSIVFSIGKPLPKAGARQLWTAITHLRCSGARVAALMTRCTLPSQTVGGSLRGWIGGIAVVLSCFGQAKW